MSALADPRSALTLVQVIAAGAVILASLEMLALHRELARGPLAPGGGPRGRALLLAAIALRAALAVPLLLAAVEGGARAALLAAVFVLWQGVSLRVRFGLEAADQMLGIVLGGLALGTLVPDDPRVQAAALWFVAVQSVLAYAVAGVAKAFLPHWRSGAFVAAMVRTSSYGRPWVAALLPPGPAARAASFGVMAFEAAFPLALLHPALAAAFCALGLAFHAVNAVVIGLNLFVPAFAATYPAIVFCAHQVQRALGG